MTLYEKLSSLLMPVDEFRTELKISPTTERKLRQENALPRSIRIGRKIYYWRQGVVDWLESQTAQNPDLRDNYETSDIVSNNTIEEK